MKTILFIPLCLLLIYGCDIITSKDQVKGFIPGIYIRHYSDVYTDSYDTIAIQPVTPGGSDGYVITKKSRFEKLNDDGKKLPGHLLKHWTGTYDHKTKTIWLPSSGKRMYFDPAKGELKIGAEPYKKI